MNIRKNCVDIKYAVTLRTGVENMRKTTKKLSHAEMFEDEGYAYFMKKNHIVEINATSWGTIVVSFADGTESEVSNLKKEDDNYTMEVYR